MTLAPCPTSKNGTPVLAKTNNVNEPAPHSITSRARASGTGCRLRRDDQAALSCDRPVALAPCPRRKNRIPRLRGYKKRASTPALHSITSSASASSVGGIGRIGGSQARSDGEAVAVGVQRLEARTLYARYYREKNVQNWKSWVTLVLEDFAALRKAGLAHPLMDEIEKRFRASR